MFFQGNMGAASGRVNPSHGMTKLRPPPPGNQNRVVGNENVTSILSIFSAGVKTGPQASASKTKVRHEVTGLLHSVVMCKRDIVDWMKNYLGLG